jgi:hypothetical protein
VIICSNPGLLVPIDAKYFSSVLPRRFLGAVLDLYNSAKADARRDIAAWYGGVGKKLGIFDIGLFHGSYAPFDIEKGCPL